MAIWYVDLEGSAGLGNGTSFANRSSALATIVTGAANGDDVRVKASDDPTSIGTCTWTENGSVTIPSGLVKEIYSDGAWTGATNVTATASTVTTLRKEGISSASMAIAAGFVTGKIAYFPLGSTQDFSAYSKISFWFRSSLASIAASTANYRLALCSDTNGDVVVNNLSFPSMQLAANYMNAINLDNGSSLGSSIQSVALYRDTTDPGTVTLIIDNMFATNDIALNTVISNNTTAEWFSIRSILGTNLIIDQGNLTINVPSKGYPKETITTETFISQGFLIAPVAAATTVHFTLSKNATQASPVTITGGWDRTSMSTQTSITHVNSRNFLGRLFNITGTWLVIEKFMFSHGDLFIAVAGDNNVIRNCSASAIDTYGIQNSGVRTNILLENNYLTNCSDGGINVPGRRIRINNCECYCNYSYGIYAIDSLFSVLSGCIVKNNTTYGFYNVTSGATQFINCSAINSGFGFYLLRSFNTIMQTCIANSNTIGLATSDSVLDCFNFSTSANSSASVSDEGTVGVNAYFYNWTRSEATPVAGLLDYNNGSYYSINDSNTIDNHIIYTDGGRISSDSSVTYTGNGISWKLQPTSTTRQEGYPLTQKLEAVPVKANVEHTASIWARRTDVGLSLIFGTDYPLISGMSLISTSLTATANIWEKLTLTFTPLEDGVIDFYVSVYGGTTFTGYWDEFEITAASKNDVSSGNYGFYKTGAYITNYPTSSATGGGETSYTFC